MVRVKSLLLFTGAGMWKSDWGYFITYGDFLLLCVSVTRFLLKVNIWLFYESRFEENYTKNLSEKSNVASDYPEIMAVFKVKT